MLNLMVVNVLCCFSGRRFAIFAVGGVGMQTNRRTITLLVFCVIVGVAAVVYVVRSDRPGVVKAPPIAVHRTKAEAVAETTPSPSLQPTQKEESLFESPPPAAESLETTEQSNPSLIRPSVDEPAMPLDEKEGEKFNYLPLPNKGGFMFERPGPDGKPVGGVVVPGHILVRRGLVELFGCGEWGRTHETIVVIDTDIQSLDTALTLAGLRRGALPRKFGGEDSQQGSRVIILVQWEDKDGRTVTYRSEDLVISLKRKSTMPRVGWTYVGRWTEVADAGEGEGGRRQKILACTGTRSLVTTFRDRTALLDNPLPEAEDDTQFAANYMVLPPSGTPVRVIFRSPVGAELKEILEVERECAKVPVDWRPDDREEREGKDRSYYERLKGPGGTPLPEGNPEAK